MGIGRKIRNRRKELGLTQTELAYAITSASTISQIETETIIPNMDLVKLLAERLNIPLSDLMDNDRNDEEQLFGEWMVSIEYFICEMRLEEAAEILMLQKGNDSEPPSAAELQMIDLFAAQIEFEQGNHEQGQQLLKQFEEQWLPIDRLKRVNALYLFLKATCLMDEGSNEHAFKYLRRLEPIKQSLPVRYIHHLLLLNARCLAECGDFQQSYKLLHEVTVHFIDQGHWIELCKTKIIKSTIDQLFNYTTEAYNELISTEKLLILVGEYRLLNLVYYQLGRIAHKNGLLEEALACLSKCVQMDQLPYNRLTADVELELAQIYYEQNRLDKALEYADKAMSSCSSNLSRCKIYLLLAALKGNGQKTNEQEQALVKASQAASACQNTLLIKKCNLLLGRFYHENGDFGKSSLYLMTASNEFNLDRPFYNFDWQYLL